MDIINGKYSPKPCEGVHWAMYCGMKDPNPERDGCVAMRDAEKTVTGLGEVVD